MAPLLLLPQGRSPWSSSTHPCSAAHPGHWSPPRSCGLFCSRSACLRFLHFGCAPHHLVRWSPPLPSSHRSLLPEPPGISLGFRISACRSRPSTAVHVLARPSLVFSLNSILPALGLYSSCRLPDLLVFSSVFPLLTLPDHLGPDKPHVFLAALSFMLSWFVLTMCWSHFSLSCCPHHTVRVLLCPDPLPTRLCLNEGIL